MNVKIGESSRQNERKSGNPLSSAIPGPGEGQKEFGDDFAPFAGCPLSGPHSCGIDEAGRGPLAGPVVAACVILPEHFPFECLGDSKALSPAARAAAFAMIREKSLAWGAGFATHTEIDRVNILNATFLAMHRAWRSLGVEPSFVFVDGPWAPPLPGCTARIIPVVRGDSRIHTIMAASIVAKEIRDMAMDRFDQVWPEYGYGRHRGYPTVAHRRLCGTLGPSRIQRLSFRSDPGPSRPACPENLDV